MSLQASNIDRIAAEWAAKASFGTLPPEQLALLEQWLAEDERHRGAFVKALAVMERVDRVGRKMDLPEFGQDVTRTFANRRRMLVGTLAASLVITATGLGVVWTNTRPEVYSTARGESRSVELADGSRVTLNTQTRLAVRFRTAERDIQLQDGEALFDVAKNKSRPFVVSAGPVRVLAVGTSFSVRFLPDSAIVVLVREGVVKIDVPAEKRTLLLKASAVAAIAPDGSVTTKSLSPLDVKRRLAWRYGQIFFQNQTLASVAAEFARYSPTAIVVDDRSVARLTISGLFRANDPAGFAKAAAGSLGLAVKVENDKIHITNKYE